MCPASDGSAGLGDALGICIPGISVLGCGIAGVAEGVGDGAEEGETVGGLLGGILCPSCCESALGPSEKDMITATDKNPCLYF